jgi:hypothetical protein
MEQINQTEITFESQCRMILKHLRNGFTITQREASRLYGCDRLGARIYDLRNGKYGIPVTPIKTTMIRSGRKRFAEYSIVR